MHKLAFHKHSTLYVGPIALQANEVKEFLALVEADKAGNTLPALSDSALQALQNLPNFADIKEQASFGRWHIMLENVNASPEGQAFLQDLQHYNQSNTLAMQQRFTDTITYLKTINDYQAYSLLSTHTITDERQYSALASNTNLSEKTIALALQQQLPDTIVKKFLALPNAINLRDQVLDKQDRVDNPTLKLSLYQRKKLADRGSTPPETLALLARDPDATVRAKVAEHIDTPAEALTMLAKDADVKVRRFVANNEAAPAETLTILAQDIIPVRRLVAGNTSTPAELLALLAKGNVAEVRGTVAGNTSTPAETLALLAQDSDSNVRSNVARNRSTPAETLALLVQDNKENIRVTVANNNYTPVEILALLAKDSDIYVRWSVADNPNTSTKTLTLLTKDKKEDVRQAAIRALQERTILDNANTLSKQDMRDKGFAGKESFDHKSTDALDKRVPGYTLDANGQNWVKYIYADDAGNEFPAELFQAFNLHKITTGNGKPLGWIGGKYDANTKTLYITEMQSDLLQRTYELNDPRLAKFKPYKSRLENRFSGWYYVFMNQAMRYAKELDVSKVALPTAQAYTKHVSGAKNIAGIYEKVLANYQHVNEGKWNVIEMAGVQKLAFSQNQKTDDLIESKYKIIMFDTDDVLWTCVDSAGNKIKASQTSGSYRLQDQNNVIDNSNNTITLKEDIRETLQLLYNSGVILYVITPSEKENTVEGNQPVLQLLNKFYLTDYLSNIIVKKAVTKHIPIIPDTLYISSSRGLLQQINETNTVDVLDSSLLDNYKQLIPYIVGKLNSTASSTDNIDLTNASPFSILMELAKNLNIPTYILQGLASTVTNNKVLEAICNHNNSTDEVLHTVTMRILRGDLEYRYLLKIIASSEKANMDTLKAIASTGDITLSEVIAHRRDLTPEVFQTLHLHENPKLALASNHNTPLDILETLSKDSNTVVRASIGSNISTPLDILKNLAVDKDEFVREAVAENPHLDKDLIANMLLDENNAIRYAVIQHHSLSPELLHKLTFDNNADVRQAATEQLHVIEGDKLSKQEMKDKGFAGKESFDHKASKPIPTSVPGYSLDAQGQDWVKYIYADDAGNEFPVEIFHILNLHKIPVGNGKPLGWIGGKYDANTQTLYITEMQSDVMQRTYELNDSKFKQYKSRLENRFNGWYYVFMNQAMRYAKELGVSKVALPTASHYVSSNPKVKNIAGIYEKVLANYQHVNEGKWNVIEMAGVQKLAFHKHSTLYVGPIALQANEVKEFLALVEADKSGNTLPALSDSALQALQNLPNFADIKEQASFGRWHIMLENVNASPEGQAFLQDLQHKGSTSEIALNQGHEATSTYLKTINEYQAYSLLSTHTITDEWQYFALASNTNLSEKTIALALQQQLPDNIVQKFLALPNAINLRDQVLERQEQAKADNPIASISLQKRQDLASNTSTPAETLTLLARDKNTMVRYYVAKNRATPAETLAMLAKDSNVDVRSSVASNRSTPPEALRLLARESRVHNILNVAGNPSTPAETLTLLAKHSNVDVREFVADNPSTSVETLNVLTKDEEDSVKRIARKALQTRNITPSIPTQVKKLKR